jgi:hypothetical protein
MKTFILSIFCCLFTVAACAQDKQTETRPVESFNGINVCCGIRVYLTEGKSSTITVKALPDDMKDLVTEVKNGILKISYKKTKIKFKKNNRIEVYVTAENLSSLEAGAGGSIEGTGDIRAKDIKINAGSGGQVGLNLKAENVTCHSNSGGNIKLTGSATTADLSANSGGVIDLKEMTVDKAAADANSGGVVRINVVDEMIASANSGGIITYYGNPPKVDKSSNSGGIIKKG